MTNDWLSLKLQSVGQAVCSGRWYRVQEGSFVLLRVSIVLKQALPSYGTYKNPPHALSSLMSQWEGIHYLSVVLY